METLLGSLRSRSESLRVQISFAQANSFVDWASLCRSAAIIARLFSEPATSVIVPKCTAISYAFLACTHASAKRPSRYSCAPLLVGTEWNQAKTFVLSNTTALGCASAVADDASGIAAFRATAACPRAVATATDPPVPGVSRDLGGAADW